MILTGQVRLGRDAEVRYTEKGGAVTTFAGAYNYGRKGDDGNRPTQWVECTLWGQQGESLSQWLTKGSAWDVTLADVHIETFTKRDQSTGFKLRGRVINIEFGATNQGGQQQQTQPQQSRQAQQSQQPVQQQNPYHDEFDDGEPF